MQTPPMIGLMFLSMPLSFVLLLRAPCITFVSLPVLITSPMAYSLFRTEEPRSNTLLTLSGESGLPSTQSLPTNLLVAALGVSHSMYPEALAKLAICDSWVPPS